MLQHRQDVGEGDLAAGIVVRTTVDPASLTTVDQNTTSTTEGPTTTVAVAFTYGSGPCPAADGSRT